MLLLLFQPLGAVAALTLTLTAPAPAISTGGVTRTNTASVLTATAPAISTAIGPPRFPASLPLLLNVTKPGFLGGNELRLRASALRTLPGGRAVAAAGSALALSSGVVTTIGSPGAADPVFALNGVIVTPIKIADFTIDAAKGSKPKTCSFVIVAGAGVTPTVGMWLLIGLQNFAVKNLIFGGTIQTCEQTSDDLVAHQEFHITAIGYTYLINRRYPIKAYVAQAGDAIARDLLTSFTTGFSGVNIVSGIWPSVSVVFDGSKDFAACMDELCRLIGGYWRVDDNKDLHLYATAETDLTPDVINAFPHPTALQRPPLRYEVDTSQVRTRVRVQGPSGGATSVPVILNGNAVLPLGSALPFGASAGFAGAAGFALAEVPIVGVPGGLSQRVIVSYTSSGQGSQITATPTLVQPPAGFLSINQVSGTALANASYLYGVSFSTLAGETPISSTSFFLPNATCNAQISAYPTPTSFQQQQGLYKVNFYRSRAFDLSGTLQYVGSVEIGTNGFWPVFVDSVPDASLGAVPPVINSAYVSNITGVTNGNSQGGGLPLPNWFAWTAPGAVLINGQAFPYTSVFGGGLSVSVPYNVPAGTRVTSSAALLGVNVSSLNGPAVSILPAGVPLSSYVQVDDAAAQAAIAALEGGDGIHEYWITDGALATPTMLRDRGLAELALFNDAKVTVRYSTRDPKTGVGRAITLNTPAPQALSGTFMIQTVHMSEIGSAPGIFPRYDVVASNAQYSLEDLLRQLGGLLSQQNLR